MPQKWGGAKAVKLRPQVFFSLLIFIFLLVFVWEAKDWRPQARLYPWAVGIPMLFLAVVQIYLDLKGAAQKQAAGATPVDFQFTQVTDPALARRRTVNIFSWVFGFGLGIWLLGFRIMVPLLVFSYLKIQSRERWALSIALTAAAWLLFWGLFDWLLTLPFPEGQLLTWFDT